MIYILGNRGNMARRYRACIEYCYERHCGSDLDECINLTPDVDRILICTPTHLHLDHIEMFLSTGLPILCEKPLTKDYDELIRFSRRHGHQVERIQMINQYQYCLTEEPDGDETIYDYYHSGADGLVWDCLNIVGMAEKRPELRTVSPYYRCQINGHRIDLQLVSLGYLYNISDWLIGNSKNNWDYAVKAHEKVTQWFSK
jgi:hypothetical protein